VIRYGLVAPPGTPRPIIDRLNKELRAALAADDLRAKLAADGAVPEPGSPEDYAAAIDVDEKKWAPIVQSLNLKFE
jgi:tripartite-type tricarboxylate transporter receptor subunit TctC